MATKPQEQSETGCCPQFDPEPWDDKEITFQDRLFVKDRVRSFFHVPLNFGQVVVRNMKLIEAAGAEPEHLMLTDERSLWGSDVYIAVDKDVPGAEMVRLSGTFLTRAFEGPYKETRHWIGQMNAHVESKGKSLQKLYFFYTTCPKCAKHYGKNYVVLFAQI